MSGNFDYFVILAEKRTGSNFLTSNLNKFAGLTAHGEAFNPYFIDGPARSQLLGMTQEMRDADPVGLLDLIKADKDGLSGFRFFSGHDERALNHFLPDKKCAKIILTRNPLDSYVSELIAWTTNQWQLTNSGKRKSAKVKFDIDGFRQHVSDYQNFQVMILNWLQSTGQTAFYLSYEDVANIDVLNGMAAFLGVESRIKQVLSNLKKQNPDSLRDKVVNYDEMLEALAGMDPFNLTRTPNFEPRRGPVVPSYVAAAKAPLMYLPVKCGPEAQVRQWLAALDGKGHLQEKFNQKTLRQWKRNNAGHRSFTVIRHPVVRAHAAFCDHILDTGPGGYPEIREKLRKDYKLPIPKGAVDETYDRRAHRKAFLAFLAFLKDNLRGHSSIRIDPAWASQAQILQGFGQFALPDMVLREDQLEQGLAQLCSQIGISATALPEAPQTCPIPLADIYDADIEAEARNAYRRDYLMFGFSALK